MDPPIWMMIKIKASTINFSKTIKNYKNCDIRRLFEIVTLDETTRKVFHAIFFNRNGAVAQKISKQKCKSVIEGVCIHKILSHKNITRSDDQSHKWEASNFYMIMPLRTLLSTHKTFCLKMNYIIWTFIHIKQIYFHILFFYFLNLISFNILESKLSFTDGLFQNAHGVGCILFCFINDDHSEQRE